MFRSNYEHKPSSTPTQQLPPSFPQFSALLALELGSYPSLPPLLPQPDCGILLSILIMPSMTLLGLYVASATAVAILINVLYQLLFRLRNKTEPPMVFHWVPFFGSTISYGMDPYKFFFACQEKVSARSGNLPGRRYCCRSVC